MDPLHAFESWKCEATAAFTSLQTITEAATFMLLHSSSLTADILFLAALHPGVTLSGIYKVASGLHAMPLASSRAKTSQFTIQGGLVEFITAAMHGERALLAQLLCKQEQEGVDCLRNRALKTFNIAVADTIDFSVKKDGIMMPSTPMPQPTTTTTSNVFHENENLRHELRRSLALQRSNQATINRLTEDVFGLVQRADKKKNRRRQSALEHPPGMEMSRDPLALASAGLKQALLKVAGALVAPSCPAKVSVLLESKAGVAHLVTVAEMVLDCVRPVLQNVTACIRDDVSLLAFAQDTKEIERVNAEGHDYVSRLQFHSQLVQDLDLFPFLGKVKFCVEKTGKHPKVVIREMLVLLETFW